MKTHQYRRVLASSHAPKPLTKDMRSVQIQRLMMHPQHDGSHQILADSFRRRSCAELLYKEGVLKPGLLELCCQHPRTASYYLMRSFVDIRQVERPREVLIAIMQKPSLMMLRKLTCNTIYTRQDILRELITNISVHEDTPSLPTLPDLSVPKGVDKTIQLEGELDGCTVTLYDTFLISPEVPRNLSDKEIHWLTQAVRQYPNLVRPSIHYVRVLSVTEAAWYVHQALSDAPTVLPDIYVFKIGNMVHPMIFSPTVLKGYQPKLRQDLSLQYNQGMVEWRREVLDASCDGASAPTVDPRSSSKLLDILPPLSEAKMRRVVEKNIRTLITYYADRGLLTGSGLCAEELADRYIEEMQTESQDNWCQLMAIMITVLSLYSPVTEGRPLLEVLSRHVKEIVLHQSLSALPTYLWEISTLLAIVPWYTDSSDITTDAAFIVLKKITDGMNRLLTSQSALINHIRLIEPQYVGFETETGVVGISGRLVKSGLLKTLNISKSFASQFLHAVRIGEKLDTILKWVLMDPMYLRLLVCPLLVTKNSGHVSITDILHAILNRSMPIGLTHEPIAAHKGLFIETSHSASQHDLAHSRLHQHLLFHDQSIFKSRDLTDILAYASSQRDQHTADDTSCFDLSLIKYGLWAWFYFISLHETTIVDSTLFKVPSFHYVTQFMSYESCLKRKLPFQEWGDLFDLFYGLGFRSAYDQHADPSEPENAFFHRIDNDACSPESVAVATMYYYSMQFLGASHQYYHYQRLLALQR